MTILHHPSELTLASYANGSLDTGMELVVQVHVERCAECRAQLRLLDQVGGALLDAEKSETVSPELLPKIWARIELDDPARSELAPTVKPAQRGKWRSLGSGIAVQPIDVPGTEGTRVFMLKASGGKWLPKHRHSDIEWTCVLQGAFTHEHGRFGAGDFDEADETMRHHPYVEEGQTCICIVALRGNVIFESWLGRMIQPFVKF